MGKIDFTRRFITKDANYGGAGPSLGDRFREAGDNIEKARIHLDTPLRNVAGGAAIAGLAAVSPIKSKGLKYGLMGGGALLSSRGIIRDSLTVAKKRRQFDAEHGIIPYYGEGAY